MTPKIIVKQTPIEWYNAINDWLDRLTELGKITENAENPVTRGDVGVLNGKLAKILGEANANYEGKPYHIEWRS